MKDYISYVKGLTGGSYTETKTERYVKTITRTLIEDDQLVDDLENFCDGRYVFCGKKITNEIINRLLENKFLITAIFKVDHDTESGFKEEWHDGSRWEGDYNPDEAHYEIMDHSFSDVLADFVAANPDRARFIIKETFEKQ